MYAAGLDHVITAPAERRRAIVGLISGARHRLLMSVFRCDDRHVVEALAAACRRGVHVEAMLTRKSKDSQTSLRLLRLLFEQIGATVRRHADRGLKYHAKYMVADESLALVGSSNFTRKCFERTSDFLVLTRDVAAVRTLTALFESDGRGHSVRATEADRVIVGPERARARLSALLQEAGHRIQIIDSKLSDPVMLELLQRRAADGIDVQILAGKQLNGRRSHGRLLIIDGRKAVVGSMAFSQTSLDARREVALLVQEPQAVAALVRQFEAARPREGTPLVEVARESVA